MQHDEGSEVRSSGMHVVIDDPAGIYWEGGLITDEKRRAFAGGDGTVRKVRAVATLPVEPALFGMNAAAGYFRRGWGGGYPLDSALPRTHCPMILFLSQRYRTLNWKARLVPKTGVVAAADQICGLLRLAQDSSQHHSLVGGLAATGNEPVSLSDLGPPDERGGWTIGGTAKIATPADGFSGFGLYGTGLGLRVLWAAITQTP